MELTVRPNPRARALRLRVDPRTGAVLLTVPPRVSRARALAWAAGHREWVEAELARVPPAVRLEPGAELPLRGVPHRIVWRDDAPRAPRVTPGEIIVGGPAESFAPRLLRWLRREARALLTAETLEIAARAGVRVGKVGVGDPVSRWGSCSSAGVIRYSWRLIFAPDFVRRATVAHEVAHRVHMNHGPAFHALAADLLEADPAPARTWLRRHGAALHRIGR